MTDKNKPTSKVIQISILNKLYLVALCEDGSIWCKNNDGWSIILSVDKEVESE